MVKSDESGDDTTPSHTSKVMASITVKANVSLPRPSLMDIRGNVVEN